MMKLPLFAVLIMLSSLPARADSNSNGLAPLGKRLSQQYSSMQDADRTVFLISFTDKGTVKHRLSSNDATAILSERSIQRRMRFRSPDRIIDEQDLPVEQSYVRTVEQSVIAVRHQLKWFNAVSVVATKQQIELVRRLPFVREVELVARWKKKPDEEEAAPFIEKSSLSTTADTTRLDYGTSFTQVNQINVPKVHNLGIYGQGVVVGVFDNGFRLLTHEAFSSMNIIAQYDFVDHKESVIPNNPSTSFGSHGVNTLSTIGGYKPGQLIGPAFKASFILARTENDSSETPIEEDNWAAAIQWADSIGVDVTSTSLGYLTFDPPYTSLTWQDMNGHTALITNAADRAVSLGIVVVNSAGNEGYNASHNTLIAPADGDSVITAGAVDAFGNRTSFSSVGPTTDTLPRIKPDVMAMGSGVKVASSTNPSGYGSASGTSFSCPLSAGVAALILCANPRLTPTQVRDAMRNTASNTASPNNLMGWGILNADSAIKYFGALPMGRISGTVFDDENKNGIMDTNEHGLSNRRIVLAGTVVESTLTDANGHYSFDSLTIGEYSISQASLPNWRQSIPTNSYSIMLLHGVDSAGLNFGNYQVLTARNGWNLLSLPRNPDNHRKDFLFPSAKSEAYISDHRYTSTDTIANGIGFWVKLTSDVDVPAFGKDRTSEALNVSAGWNMTGTLSLPVAIANIQQTPPNNLRSPFYYYDSTYKVAIDSLYPGNGYWVKVKEPGNLLLDAVRQQTTLQQLSFSRLATPELNTIEFINAANLTQRLYYSDDASLDSIRSFYEMPPPPPSGAFDVRFADGYGLALADSNQTRDVAIIVSSPAYPLTIRWTIVGSYRSASLNAGGTIIGLDASGETSIGTPVTYFRLRLPSPGSASSLVIDYSLNQNYPNPFNPLTIFDFQLPIENHVTLKVYDILGREVVTLVDEVKQPGEYTVRWNASGVSSGVYYYRIVAGDFSQSRKLVLLK